MNIKVYSEIGKLNKVLVHRPGLEVERLYPEIFERILFDDIMHVEKAQEEHDFFTEALKNEGIEVYYIEKMVADLFDKKPELRTEFLNEFIEMSGAGHQAVKDAAFEFWNQIKDNLEFVRTIIAGIKKNEMTPKWGNDIASHVAQHDTYPFYIDPIPNILFQRDPIASVFDGINLHEMANVTRRREGIFYKYLFLHDEEWASVSHPLDLGHEGTMEGGDVLVMNKETIFVGVSERTSAEAVEALARSLFKDYSDLKRVIGIEIPKSHATMHLDTVFTQMDVDKFSIDADMYEMPYVTYEITPKGGDIAISVGEKKMEDILKAYITKNAKLYVVAGGDPVAAPAEQWSDGANCLAIAPGTIVVYNRNVHTNKVMTEAGIKLIEIPSGELSRGRGGPRCMSMPLDRDDV